MSNFFKNDDALRNIYTGANGQFCHPNSPVGGGGCLGPSRIPGTLGLGTLSNWGQMSFPHPQSPAARQLTQQQIEKHFMPKAFGVTDIPSVMREKMKWPKSAALMDMWLNGSEKIMTLREKSGVEPASSFPSTYISKELFTVNWLRSFMVASTGYSTLIKKLKTPNSTSILKERVKLQQYRQNIGELKISNQPLAVNLHTDWQFQFEPVGFNLFEGMDDLYGSLGRFAWYAAVVEGAYAPPTQAAKSQLRVSKVGIYMRDTYDFIGSQYLGHWNHEGMIIDLKSLLMARMDDEFESNWNVNHPGLGTLYPINNSDFNSYRQRTHKGGDIMVFSDVSIESVDLTFDF